MTQNYNWVEGVCVVDSWIQVDWRNWLELVRLPFLAIRRNSDSPQGWPSPGSSCVSNGPRKRHGVGSYPLREPVACWGALMGAASPTAQTRNKNTLCGGAHSPTIFDIANHDEGFSHSLFSFCHHP
jgi:hypothetical protein